MKVTLGLRGRIILTYLTLIILGVGGLVIRFGLLEQTRLISEAEDGLEIKAFLLAPLLNSQMEDFVEGELSYAAFSRSLEQMSQNVEARMTLLTVTGDPIYDSQINFRDIPNQQNQLEVQHAFDGSEQHQIRFDPSTNEKRLFVGALVTDENEAVGVVQLSIPFEIVQAKIRQSWLILISTGLVMVAATIAAGLWLANDIIRPLKTVQEAAEQMAAGNLEQQIEITGNDELGSLAHAFNNMAAQLNQMITQQHQFVANASHEIRTPLTNIKLQAEALLNGGRDDPQVLDQFLQGIEQEADRMTQLTNRLLVLSSFDSRQELTKTEPINLSAILLETVSHFSSVANAKNIEIALDLPPFLPPINANPEQIGQVFDNLVGNAIKYTPAGGIVALAALDAKYEVTVTISDTGQGIPSEDLPHIFERFYRVDKARTRTNYIEGSGLGLSITEEIVKAHRGQIEVFSRPGEGTTFKVRFPLNIP